MKTVIIWVESVVIVGLLIVLGMSIVPQDQRNIYKYSSSEHTPICKKAPCPTTFVVEIRKDTRLINPPEYLLRVYNPTASYGTDKLGYEVKFTQLNGVGPDNESSLKPNQLNQTEEGMEISWKNGSKLFIPQSLY